MQWQVFIPTFDEGLLANKGMDGSGESAELPNLMCSGRRVTCRDNDDPLFLQAKEAYTSVLEEFVGKSDYTNHGERVVAGQHLMQAASDIFLGWERAKGLDEVTRDYYLRQLRDWKGSFDVEGTIPPGLTKYVGVCAQTLGPRPRFARAIGSPSPPTSGTGTPPSTGAIGEFAETYADQKQRDFEAVQKAAASGRIKVESGL